MSKTRDLHEHYPPKYILQPSNFTFSCTTWPTRPIFCVSITNRTHSQHIRFSGGELLHTEQLYITTKIRSTTTIHLLKRVVLIGAVVNQAQRILPIGQSILRKGEKQSNNNFMYPSHKARTCFAFSICSCAIIAPSFSWCSSSLLDLSASISSRTWNQQKICTMPGDKQK